MIESDMALVWSNIEDGKLRLEVVDDTAQGHDTVCVIKIDPCDVGGLLAGRRSAPIELSLPRERVLQ